MIVSSTLRLCVSFGCLVFLVGCEENPFNALLKPAEQASASQGASGEVVERDVEAPDVFSVAEAGLWDGRPSLGGVWAAHPDVDEPERIVIRNLETETFVIGALFRKERETPGPRLQISSDAAEALGMIAGQPVQLSVVALRREEVELTPPAAETLEAPDVVETTTLTEAPLNPETGSDISDAEVGPPSDSTALAAAAAAAIDAAVQDVDTAQSAAATVTPSTAAPAPSAIQSALKRPFIQLGIFSVEANATRSADRMRKIGIVPQVLKQSSRGKTFWRVIVGPATSEAERGQLLQKIKAEGFEDAYAVTN